jgi:hypothetical protein
VEAAPTLERVLNLDAPINLGPETIAASDCFKALFELWNDLQMGLHDMARKLWTTDHGRAPVFLDRHVTQPDPHLPDGVTSGFGAIWRRGRYLALKPFRGDVEFNLWQGKGSQARAKLLEHSATKYKPR